MKKRWLSLTVSFLYAGFAQAYECVKPKTKRPEGCSQQMPDDLIPLYNMFRFTYVPNILDTVNAGNEQTGGGGGTGNVCRVRNDQEYPNLCDEEGDDFDDEAYDDDEDDAKYDYE